VEAVEYPLIFKAQGRAPYFQKREEWRITDMLMNPMVSVFLAKFDRLWDSQAFRTQDTRVYIPVTHKRLLRILCYKIMIHGHFKHHSDLVGEIWNMVWKLRTNKIC